VAYIKDMIASPTRVARACLVAGLGWFIPACSEDTTAPTAPEPALEVSAAAAPALNFRMVATGGFHTCGVASDNRAYCWGLNGDGQLGVGHRLNRSRPTPVDRPLLFLQVDGGNYHSCGVTTDNLAYCWGNSEFGQLGFGGFRKRVRPVPVAGGLRFRQVSLGALHSCGVTTDNRAYCWGANYAGQLGDGTTTRRPAPVAVAGGLRFRRIGAGGYTCGVTTADKVYCWGGEHHVPTAIPGGLSFRSVSAGCAITADRKGYCWESYGQPQPVSGFSFTQLVRSGRTCGVTTASKAYCWGDNFAGALGDGTETDRTSPTAVLGGIMFSGVSPGPGYHTCGTNTLGRVYCWGHNAYGQLGLGNNTGPETCTFVPCSRRPRAVIGPA
jgi:alpha-tubulin suppressor-like RCC1 family protein